MKQLLFFLAAATLLFGQGKTFYLGQTYDFAEENMLSAIKSYAYANKDKLEKAMTDFRGKAKEKIWNFKPDLVPLTPATKARVFYPDMTYTVDKDIYDAEGKVLYPKGFQFNPGDYLKLSYSMIVVDGTNRREIEWLKKSNFLDNFAYRILLSDGNYHDISEELGQHVFFCMEKISKGFKLEHTPSIISQVDNKIRVEEICLPCEKEKKEGATDEKN